MWPVGMSGEAQPPTLSRPSPCSPSWLTRFLGTCSSFIQVRSLLRARRISLRVMPISDTSDSKADCGTEGSVSRCPGFGGGLLLLSLPHLPHDHCFLCQETQRETHHGGSWGTAGCIRVG